MRTLTHREKRTVQIGALVVAACFVILGATKGAKYFGKRRGDYRQLVLEAQELKREVGIHQARAAAAQKLMDGFHMDPAQLSRTSVVAQASAAIQKAAMTGGMQLGPIRESPARTSSKELASVQLEGSGPVPAVMAFLNQLEGVGYPVIIDSVQLTPDMRPGQLKLSLTLVILDFEQWKKEAVPHA